ncbi:putative MFS transporter [Aspergillus tanneri]|uniref:Major facilitator superfamily (MFS) profile domain-containing protein n=1 Tax=Aspergillus tanneri TaxID=1220188 RepID=A0A5M9MC73_9EURO|nr:uncharacterized protein ATNIH1004_011488 [Aspergillus tanneri]KAA8642543.1 hypothetical protein ATNIH1004_011488 [Aspergillus tanneri]
MTSSALHEVMLDEKGIRNTENFVSDAAGRGHAATDRYGRALVEFDRRAERRLCLKIDLYIIPTVALLYLFCFIDRANIGNAKLAGLEKDLRLEGNDYNAVLSIFYISYIIFEIPCNVVYEVSLLSAWLSMSLWHHSQVLLGGLLASAILTLDHFGSLRAWRMIFAIEGIITIGLGLLAFLTLTDRPETARWLTQEEKDLAIARLKSERIATTEVLDKIDRAKMLRGIFSPVTLGTSFIFLLNNITVQGLAFFAPTIVRTIYPDSSVVSQQLHTVPPYVVGAFFTVFFPFLSWRFDNRVVFLVIAPPLVMTGYIMFLASTNAMVRYGATFIIASGAFSFGPLCNAHVSNNVVSDTARSAAIGTNVMFGNIGGLISTWSFLQFDAPNYQIGNGLNLATSSLTMILGICMWLWMRRDNMKREKTDVDQALAGMSQKQIQDLDWRNPAFRWRK